MARAVGSLGIGIESTIGTRDDLLAAGASEVYPGVAEFVDEPSWGGGRDEQRGRRAIVLADGAAPTRAQLDAAWPGWDAGIALVVAADGGARHATALGLRVDRWVGDGDSIDPDDLATWPPPAWRSGSRRTRTNPTRSWRSLPPSRRAPTP